MEYEGKIRVELSAGVSVEGTSREDAKRKLERLHERLVKFLESEGMVDEVYPWKQESYVYTDENWKPTPRLEDERYLVYEIGSEREYFEEYYDGDETRIEYAVEDVNEAEWGLLKEIEVGEIYFKRGYEWRNVRKDYYPCCHSDTAKGDLTSNGDLVDAMFATGEDVDELRIYVDMKTGALFYDYGMRSYELVEAEKVWNEDEWDYSYLNERKLGPKVYAHFMGQDAADEAFRHLNEGVEPMRKRRLLYDALSEQVREKRTDRYTYPVFDEWRELIDFLSDVDVDRLKVEQNCYWSPLLAMDEFPRSIVEVLEWFGKENVIVYIDRLGEFKIEYEDEDMCSDVILSIADRRFVGDLEPLGLIVEEYLKYVC